MCALAATVCTQLVASNITSIIIIPTVTISPLHVPRHEMDI
jgi:hypothetical protein